MITLHNVQKLYPPDQMALKGIDLKISQGSFVFVAGASGAGKTTLFKLLFGAERATSGQVVVAGRNLSEMDSQGIADLRKDIGVVFQDYKLLQRRTVWENVAFGLEVKGVRASERKKVAQSMLDAVGLSDKADRMPLTLSGGEQQRVSLARALIHRPKLLLADEPTGNLDPDMTQAVFDLLLEANADGVTIVVATHNLSVIEELRLRTVVLDRGKIIGDFKRPLPLD
ncbi:MAG: cell division ATP-binding protein FtsE [Bdellovibrionota bacterium]|jgi:cell division transport system ATP-binding protein